MGLDYSFHIVLSPNRAADLLRNVAAASAGDTGPTTVLVGGERIEIPCTSGFQAGKTLTVDDSPLTHRGFGLDLSLHLTADELVEAYLAECPTADGRIGYVYAGLAAADWYRPGHLAFDFMAATTRMSRLFQDSNAVRRWFADLAIRSGAAICLLDVEDGQDWLVMAHGRQVFKQLSWSHHDLRCRCTAGGGPLPGLELNASP